MSTLVTTKNIEDIEVYCIEYEMKNKKGGRWIKRKEISLFKSDYNANLRHLSEDYMYTYKNIKKYIYHLKDTPSEEIIESTCT